MDNNCTPIQFMAAMLAEMGQRATDAELQLKKEKQRADEIFKSWIQDGKKCEMLEAELLKEKEEHQHTRELLDAALGGKKKGGRAHANSTERTTQSSKGND